MEGIRSVKDRPLLPVTGLEPLWISAMFTRYSGWDYFRASVCNLFVED